MAGLSTITYSASGTDITINPNLNTTFTLAIEALISGNNFRHTEMKANLGLPVNNNYQTTVISLPPNTSVNLCAAQLIFALSDQPLLATIVPDASVTNTNPGSATHYGNLFAFTGSYLNTGMTLLNSTTSICKIQVALIS